MDFKALMIRTGQKVFAFIELTRVSVIFMGIPFALAGAAYALSITHLPISVIEAILGVVGVFFMTGAVHAIDDYFDRERDRYLWPDRQIPSRGTNVKTALAISVSCYGIGFCIIGIFYNIYCVTVLLIAAIWATAYTGYLRERVGYLTLPFAIGLFPIGGYVAFSPSTLWSDPIPWMLYLMVFVWQSAHILAYSPPHGVTAGKTVVPVLLKRFSPRATILLAGAFSGTCMLTGVFIFILSKLSYLYLGMTTGFGFVLLGMSIYVARNLTVKNCMRLVFANSTYGWGVFFIMSLEFLIRYDMVFFYILLVFGLFMMVLTPVLGGFGMPANMMELDS